MDAATLAYMILSGIGTVQQVIPAVKGIQHGDKLNKLTEYFSKNKNILDELINAYEEKNFSYANNIIGSHPMLTKSLKDIERNKNLLSQIKLKRSEIEGKLTAKINELAEMNSEPSIIKNIDNALRNKRVVLENEIDALKNQYNAQIAGVKLMQAQDAEQRERSLKPNFSQSTLNQNIKGGTN